MIVVDWWLILSTTTTCNFPCRTGCQDANSHCACQKRTNNAVCFRINGAHNAKSLCFRCNAPRIGSGSCEDIVALLLKMRLIPHIQVPSLMEATFYLDLGTSSNSDQISPIRYEYISLIEASMVAQRPKNTHLLIIGLLFFNG
ncbi:unnamed protein product [Urochloa humidicola]